MISNNQRLEQIRELLIAHPQGLSVTEISAALGVNKNSTGRYLDTLYAAGEIKMRRFGMAKLYTSAARMPLSAMMSLPSDLILIVDADGIITFINDPYLALLNLTEEQVINKHITTIRGVAPDTEVLKAAFAAAAEGHEVKEMIRFNGGERIFLRRCVPITLDTGEAGTAVIMEEVTALVRAEQALHEQEVQINEIIENLQDIYYRTDQQDTLIYANRQILLMLGYDSMDLVLGRSITSFWAEPDKRKKFSNLIRKRGAINDFETTILRADGSLLPVSISSHLRYTGDGEILGLSGTIRDITRRKQNEEAIQWLSAHNRAMIETNLDPIASIECDGTITDVNEAMVTITGYPREGLIGTKFSRYFADPVLAEQIFGEVVSAGLVRNRYIEMIHADGHRTPTLCNAALYRSEDGTLTGGFASFRDITNQQQMDRALTRSEGLLQMMAAVFVNSGNPIAIKNPDGEFSYANPAVCRMLGYAEKELKAMDWKTDLTPQEWWETEADALERLKLTGEPQTYRKELLHRDGHRVPVEVVTHLIHETTDLPLYYCSFITDISGELQAEQQQRACELRFLHLINTAPIGVWAADSTGRIELANRPMEDLLGCPVDEVLGRQIIDLFEQAGCGEVHHLGDRLVNGEQNVPLALRRKDCTLIETLLTTSPITDQQGQYQGMVGFLLDQTHEKQQERMLIEAGRRLSAMNDQIPLVTLQFDGAGTLISCNDALIAKTGWIRSQVLGRDWHRHLVPPELTGDLEKTLKDVITDEGTPKNWTGPMLTAGGRVLQIRWTCLVLYDDQQQFAGITCLGEDITDQLHLAGMLQKTGQQYLEVLEIMPYPTVLIDTDWTITQANREFTTALQYTVPERPRKLTLLSIISPESRPAVTALLNREEGGLGTCTAIRGDGTAISVMVRPGPCQGDGPRMLVLMIDQTPEAAGAVPREI